MKVAEALAERGAANRKLKALRERAATNAWHAEGDQGHQDPNTVLSEIPALIDTITGLIRAINRTNSATLLDQQITITDGLARRDTLSMHIGALEAVLRGAEAPVTWRVGERGIVVDVDIAVIVTQIEALNDERRQLDNLIQRRGWEVDLIT